MRYKLSLTKRQMYDLVRDAYPNIPPCHRCEFNRYRCTYWLYFYDDSDNRIKATLQTVLGETTLRIDNHVTGKNINLVHYNGQYLLDNRMLTTCS